MPNQYPGCFDRSFFRGPNAATGDDPGNPPPRGAALAAAAHCCR